MNNITWTELCWLEPRLLALYKECAAERDNGGPSYCANRLWYRKYKARLVGLVGDEAENNSTKITSSSAYDIAYRKCYGALPDCRDCTCL